METLVLSKTNWCIYSFGGEILWLVLIIIPAHHHQYSSVQLGVLSNQRREQKQNDKQFNLTFNHASAEW